MNTTTIKIDNLNIVVEYTIQPMDRQVGIDEPFVEEFKVVKVADSIHEGLCEFFNDFLNLTPLSTEKAIMDNHDKEMEESRYNISAEDYEWTRYR